MKNKLIILASVIAISIAVLLYGGQAVNAIGAMLRSGADVPNGSLRMRTNATTASPEFLQNGIGTTTFTFASENFSSLVVNLQVFASSTNQHSPLSFKLQSSDENTDFFDYDPTILAGNFFLNRKGTTTIETASSTVPYTYQPIVNGATTTKSLNVNLIPARYTRIIFSIASSTNNSTAYRDGMNLWVNIIGQNSGVK